MRSATFTVNLIYKDTSVTRETEVFCTLLTHRVRVYLLANEELLRIYLVCVCPYSHKLQRERAPPAKLSVLARDRIRDLIASRYSRSIVPS